MKTPPTQISLRRSYFICRQHRFFLSSSLEVLLPAVLADALIEGKTTG